MTKRARKDSPLILLVDDFPDNREMYAQYLKFSGMRVAEASNGHEALDQAFQLHPDLKIARPRAETPLGTLTFGFDEDLDEAMAQAVDGMLDVLHERHGLERREALALASLVVDLRITQVVNGVRGVHAVLPDGALG